MSIGDDDFVEDNPLANAGQPLKEPSVPAASRLPNSSGAVGKVWNESGAGDKVAIARERTELFVRENPLPVIVGALAVGVAIGWALRHATREDEEVELQTPLGRVNWSYLSLPFLWPFLKSVKERAGDSADTLKDVARDGMDRVRNIDIQRYAKPIRKRWKSWLD